MEQPKEVRSLTGLRGVAALYVVGYHFTRESYPLGRLGELLNQGYLAVDLFFVLSGFVMAMNYTGMFASGWSRQMYLKFLGRRIARVYPLYIVCTLLGFVLMRIGQLPSLAHCSSIETALGTNLAMVQAWGVNGCRSVDIPAWSISAEWAAYLLFPVLLVPALLRKPLFAWMCGGLCVAVLAGLCALPVSLHADPIAGNLLDFVDGAHGLAVVRCVAEFMLGLLAYRAAQTVPGRAMGESRLVAPLLCCMTIAALLVRRLDLLTAAILFPLLIVSLASGSRGMHRILSSKAAERMGVLSYGIYLVHMLFGGLRSWLQAVYISHGIAHAHAISEITRVMAIAFVVVALHRLVEVPGRQWLRRLFEPDTRLVVAEGQIATERS